MPPLARAMARSCSYTAETGDLRFTISAYEPGYRGGVRVGTGDFNSDGIPDVVTVPGPDHSPVIKVFDSKTGDQLAGPLGSFLPMPRRSMAAFTSPRRTWTGGDP